MRARHLGPRTAFFVVGLLLLGNVVLVPFAISSVFADVVEQSSRTFRLAQADGAAVYVAAHVDLVDLNEWDGEVSLRVTVHQSCGGVCPWGDRLLFVSVFGDTETTEELPPSQLVVIPATTRDVKERIKLPVAGDPIRYPFDRYQLVLGVIVEHLLPDGSVQTLSDTQAQRYVSLSVRARIDRMAMHPPQPLDGRQLQADQDIEPYAYVGLLTFTRPRYLQVLTVLLVLLVTGAAAYAVVLRPLDQLITNSGALVLGVWGIRAILLGTGLSGLTAVDLALSMVILFLLTAVTVRTLYLLKQQSELQFRRRRRRATAAAPPAAAVRESTAYLPDPTPRAATAYVPGRSAEAAAPDGVTPGGGEHR